MLPPFRKGRVPQRSKGAALARRIRKSCDRAGAGFPRAGTVDKSSPQAFWSRVGGKYRIRAARNATAQARGIADGKGIKGELPDRDI